MPCVGGFPQTNYISVWHLFSASCCDGQLTTKGSPMVGPQPAKWPPSRRMQWVLPWYQLFFKTDQHQDSKHGPRLIHIWIWILPAPYTHPLGIVCPLFLFIHWNSVICFLTRGLTEKKDFRNHNISKGSRRNQHQHGEMFRMLLCRHREWRLSLTIP